MKVAGRILKIIFFLGILGSGIFYISKALLPRIPDFYEEEPKVTVPLILKYLTIII